MPLPSRYSSLQIPPRSEEEAEPSGSRDSSGIDVEE